MEDSQPSVLLRGVGYGSCALTTLILLYAAYCVLLHPLRKYPGPFLARFTDAYAASAAMMKRSHLATYQNFIKYGPVFRPAPNRLLFNTITALNDIYLNPRVTKGQAYRSTQLRAKFPSLINALDKDQHRRKRKFMAQPITERSMRKFEPTMVNQVDIFLQQLLQSCQRGEIVNMTDRCQRLGVDIVGQLAFGYSFKTQTEETYQYISQIMGDMSYRMNIYMQCAPLWSFEMLMVWLNKEEFIKFDKAIRTMIQTRMSEDKDAYYDLWSILADHIGKGPGNMLPGELWPEAIFFLMAGGSTTSTTMSSMFFYLSRNPMCYATLAKEIRSTFNSVGEICSGTELNSCKYLRACIDETLRMTPATLTNLWRELDPKDTSDEPFLVDGHVIPRGTQVGVGLYSILHNEDYFPDPFTFKPERWLDPSGTPDEVEKQMSAQAVMRKAFVPFSIGDRACAGKAMAYLESSLTIARALWFFDFDIAPGKAGELGSGQAGRTDGRGRTDEYQLDDILVAGHQGPNLIFRKRGDFWKTL